MVLPQGVVSVFLKDAHQDFQQHGWARKRNFQRVDQSFRLHSHENFTNSNPFVEILKESESLAWSFIFWVMVDKGIGLIPQNDEIDYKSVWQFDQQTLIGGTEL